MLDRYNRKIDYLRVSVTDRCNLRCIYCMPEEGIFLKTHNEIMSYEKILSVIQVATRFGIKKIRLTGGEPLVRQDISFLIKEIKKVNGIEELTLTTNGVLLSKMAQELKEAGLDRINVSLDTLDPEKYRQITRIGEIDTVLRGIEAINSVDFKRTKINMVLIPGINDQETGDMRAFCVKNGLTLQRINHYSLRDYNSINRKYDAERPLPCELCDRIRLTADGKLKPCLFSDMEIPVNFENIGESLKKAILSKPESGTVCMLKQNWQIGG
jgi:cyclic pyranopterin phosphate synthase